MRRSVRVSLMASGMSSSSMLGSSSLLMTSLILWSERYQYSEGLGVQLRVH